MIRFAFSTISAPNWDFAAAVARAAELGYDGLEISESIAGLPPSPQAVLDLLKPANLSLACVSTACTLGDDAGVRRAIETAAGLQCKLVKILDPVLEGSTTLATLSQRFADWIKPLADRACDAGVILAVENARALRKARNMWAFLELADHPALCACWDLAHAAAAGETPAVSVPTLNSKIAHAHVKDVTLGQPQIYKPFGEGDVQVQRFMIRLLGIGYNGWVTVAYDTQPVDQLPAPEVFLADALAKLKTWTAPPKKEAPAKKEPPAKKPAPATV